MKHNLLSLCCMIIFIVGSGIFNELKAQKTPTIFFIHGLFSTPIDKSSRSRFSSGIGAEGGVGFGLKSTVFVGSVGYTSFHSKSAYSNILGTNESYIPVKVGIRQYLPLNKIFGDANLGVGFVNNNIDSSKSRFAFDVGGGVKFGGFEAGLNVDAFKEVKPNGWSSWIVLKAGFSFGK